MAALMPVDEALARMLDGVPADGSMSAEHISLHRALGRIMAAPVVAREYQPPFAASAMDGYAVRAADVAVTPAVLNRIGEAAAGHPFSGSVAAGEAVRIFTGAQLPAGADAIVIQENTTANGTAITIAASAVDEAHVRKRGIDYRPSQMLIAAGSRLTPRTITLAAAAGAAQVTVRRRPLVAILATGDELVDPAVETLGPGQIRAANHVGIAAMVEQSGGEPLLLGIAKDTRASLDAYIAKSSGADVLVTIGGASVGDHDLVAPALMARGMQLDFWKIAMRPGKPLMYGRLGNQRVIGLPGNPVSALITARIFLVPLIRALLGAPRQDHLIGARTTIALDSNGPRTHYMRAVLDNAAAAETSVTPLPSQDSSLMSPLARADGLLIRPAGSPALAAGAMVPVLPLDF